MVSGSQWENYSLCFTRFLNNDSACLSLAGVMKM